MPAVFKTSAAQQSVVAVISLSALHDAPYIFN